VRSKFIFSPAENVFNKHKGKPFSVQGWWNCRKIADKIVWRRSYMPRRKKAGRSQAERTVNAIRYGALLLIVVVVGVVTWNLTPHRAAVPGSPACGLFDTIPASSQYDSAPPLLIDPAGKYHATIVLEKGGEIQLDLYADRAPNTVNNFMFLSCKGFYDGVTFHRVLEGFMAQTGDPQGTGMGSAGYRFDDEISDLTFDSEGVVAMANSGPDTNGSQFFITFGPTPHLDGGYTIFGQVTSGMDVVSGIRLRDPDQGPTYVGDAIETILITEE
jgi:cyclophilin family peptidyl-prolyl cis-trans isomerase